MKILLLLVFAVFKVSDGSPVVFSVYLNDTVLIDECSTIIFPSEITNTGDFITTGGIFIAPKKGYYSFTVSFVGRKARAWIMRKKCPHPICRTHSVGFTRVRLHPKKWSGNAVTVNVKLHEGGKVWVVGIGRFIGVRYPPFPCPRSIYTSFAGFRIK